MANDDLFGLLTVAYDGVAKAVADGQDHLAKAVKQAEADANARRLIGTLQDPKSDEVAINSKLSGEAIFRYLKLMSKLDNEEKLSLSDGTRGKLLEMMESAANNPKLSILSDYQKDQVDTMMKEAGRPVVFSTEPPLQFFSDASSTTSGSSIDGSTGTKESTDTIKSGVIALKELTDQKRKKNGPQNGPLASPPSASVSKGLKSEGGKKTQSASWGAAVKDGFSKCQTCLYNAGEFAFSSVKKFFNANLVEPISKYFREPDASERARIDATYEQVQRERQAYKEAEKELLMAPFNAVKAKLSEMWTGEIKYENFDTTVDTGLRVSNKWRGTQEVSMQSMAGSLGNAGTKFGAGGASLAVRGVEAAKGLPGSLKSAGGAIGNFGASAGRFAFTSNGYGSSTASWTERLEGMGRLTEGMGSGDGPGSVIKDGAKFLSTPGTGNSSLPSGSGVAKLVVRGGARALGSMASMVNNARFTIPTIGPSR